MSLPALLICSYSTVGRSGCSWRPLHQPGEEMGRRKCTRMAGHLQSLFSWDRVSFVPTHTPTLGHSPRAGTATSIAEKAKHSGWKARLPCWQRLYEKHKWAVFKGAQREIPKGGDLGPVGAWELEGRSSKEGFSEEVILSLIPRISKGLQGRTGGNGSNPWRHEGGQPSESSHLGRCQTGQQQPPTWSWQRGVGTSWRPGL